MKRSKTLSVRTAVRRTREVRLFLAIACSVVLLSLNLPGAIHADDGDLDPGFGEGGKAVMDEWTSTGPEGGPVGAIAVDPSNPEVVYAGASLRENMVLGAQGGGVYKSLNGGKLEGDMQRDG